MERYDSYAIVATKSPIVLREIPSRCICKLIRSDDLLHCYRPAIECFGETLFEISNATMPMFADEVEPHYKKVLKAMAKKQTEKEVNDAFANGLGLSPRMVVKNEVRSKEKENEE